MRWQAPRAQLQWVDCDEGFVLFHHPSGQTHFLNPASASLLLRMTAAPTDLDEAVRLLSTDQPTPGLTAHVADILARFEGLGLIERTRG